MATPDVSVVIPGFNRAGTIQRAISSALVQTVEDLEVLVVDDGSTDGTAEISEAIDDSRVRVIRRASRGGGGAARNSGIEASRGEYVAFLDSDDEWRPDKLERQLDAMSAARDCVSACGFTVLRDGVHLRAVPGLLRGDAFERLLSLEGGPVTCSVITVTRGLVQEGLRFDERFPALQDLDFLLQAAKAGVRFVGPADALAQKYSESGRDRVFTPTNETAARHLLLEKYRDDLAPRPRSYVRQQRALALAEVRSGDVERARSTLQAAARRNSGPGVTRTLEQILRVSPRAFDVAARAVARAGSRDAGLVASRRARDVLGRSTTTQKGSAP